MNGYTYRCIITGTCGCDTSNPGNLTVNTALSAPPYIYARKSGGDVYVWWHPVTKDTLGNTKGVDHYNVYRGKEKDFKVSPSTLLASTAENSFTDPQLEKGKEYYYRVTAMDNWGNASNPSETLTVRID